MTHRRDSERKSRGRLADRTFGASTAPARARVPNVWHDPRARTRTREAAERVATAYRCPDCAADTALADQDGVLVLTVAHDTTCPHYAGRTA